MSLSKRPSSRRQANVLLRMVVGGLGILLLCMLVSLYAQTRQSTRNACFQLQDRHSNPITYNVGPGISEVWVDTIELAADEWNAAGSSLHFTRDVKSRNEIDLVQPDNAVLVRAQALMGGTMQSVTESLRVRDAIVFHTLVLAGSYSTKLDKPSAAQYDLYSILVHEFGHWAGFSDTFLEDCADTVMYFKLAPGQTKRTLSAADRAIVRTLYP